MSHVEGQLTTPMQNQHDPCFPGENFFFYWRTSPSLWESKIISWNKSIPIYIPLFWALHHTANESFDFGENRPETDLARLMGLAQTHRKEILFLLPLSPCPFLPNGGLPSFLAGSPVFQENGIVAGLLDNESRLQKLYSFYEPKVLKAFNKFAWKLSRFLNEQAINAEVFGCNFGTLDGEGRFQSFFKDFSPAFYSGFKKYLNANEMKIESRLPGLTHRQENLLKDQYQQEVSSLYLEIAKDSFGRDWGGVLNFVMLGGKIADLFARSSDQWRQESEYFSIIENSYALGVTPTSVLVPFIEKTPLLNFVIEENFYTYNAISESTGRSAYDSDLDVNFNAFHFFEVYKKNHHPSLYPFLIRNFPSLYLYKNEATSHEENFLSPIGIFSTRGLAQGEFKKIVNFFLSGRSVILDTKEMNTDDKKSLDSFVYENNFQLDKVNFEGVILTKITLGENSFFHFDSTKLNEKSKLQQDDFWKKIVSLFELKQVECHYNEGVYSFWKSRPSNAYELNYEEIRRLILCNTTSYVQKVSVNPIKHFAFIKAIDPYNAEIKSVPIGVEIELKPQGRISLDFGCYD